MSEVQFVEHEAFPGGSEMGSLMRAFDWRQTPLGPVEEWPQSLKAVSRILLTSRYAMWMGWGKDLTFLYNDTYGQMTLGKKHPWALGKPAREVWREIWPDIGPRIQKVLDTGVATWDEGLLLFLERSGYPEETYHTFSYSPLLEDDGRVMGMLCVVTEETERILGERRLRALRSLASELGTAIAESELLSRIEGCLRQSQMDLPFTLTYLFHADGSAHLACGTGLGDGHRAAPGTISPEMSEASWPFRGLIEKGGLLKVDDLAERFGRLPSGAWEKPSDHAVLVPLQKPGQEAAAGFFVAGLNPYRRLDAEYSGFVELIARQIAAGLGNARAYEEERRRAELLAEVDRAKTAFFTNISHEFRTPLTLMLGPLEQSISRLEVGQGPIVQEAEHLRVVHRNGLRLLKLVNALLDFSRIEAGRAEVRLQAVDLGSFTGELASMFRSATEKAGIELIVDCASTADKAYVDPDSWEKIVLNLVSNAFKFTLKGSIRVRLTREGECFRLDVSDTGSGIAPDQLPRIFERFHRIEGAPGRTIEGTGIGLALVQELVRLQHGTIHAASALNQGTTFTVLIPATKPPANSGPGSEEANGDSNLGPSSRASDYLDEVMQWLPEHTLSRAANESVAGSESAAARLPGVAPFRVMVVDDNADMRDYLRRLLSQRWKVEVFASGREALAAAIGNPPNLVVTDVMMPGLDGFGLVKALRESAATTQVPIIMLSARAGEEARIEGLQAGVDSYLVKPFSARELLESVKSQLMLRQRSAQFETLVNAAPIAIVVMDAQLRFRHVNPVARPIFGREQNLIGCDFSELIRKMWGDAYGDEIVRICKHTLETGESFIKQKDAEFRVDRQQTEYYEWRVDRISLPEGEFGIVGYFRDISMEIKAEEALRQSEKLAVVGRMAASISHEINNPLEAVTNLIYLIRTCPDPNLLGTYFDLIDQELARVNDIVTHGLRFHRQSSGSREESISELVKSAAAIYQGRLHSGPASLLCDFKESRRVWGLGGELRQVFANFVGNAFDATMNGGQIELRTRDAIHPVTREPGVRLTIADSGVGMSAETKSRLFEPFFTTKNIAGTGLGLWLSKEILVRHAASLHVKSRNSGLRRGTVFSIFFPARGVAAKSGMGDDSRFREEPLRREAGGAEPRDGRLFGVANHGGPRSPA